MARNAERNYDKRVDIGSTKQYHLIEKTVLFLERNHERRPRLEETAEQAGLSTAHFLRLFRSYTGLTPLQYMDHLSCEFTKKLLRESESVLDASIKAGFGSPGRLHDLFIRIHAVTPGEYKKGGEALEIGYGTGDTPFGTGFIAFSPRGITNLFFIGGDGPEEALKEIKGSWSNAEFSEKQAEAEKLLKNIFCKKWDSENPFDLHLKGTNFQINVWKALLSVPEGSLVNYGTVAAAAGKEKAVRAAGSAVGSNPVSYLIPCHRVIRSNGSINQYRWGAVRKKIMLLKELSPVFREENPDRQ